MWHARIAAKKSIIFLSEIKNSNEDLEIYNNCLKLFENNILFREGCLATSKWILDGKGILENIINEDIIDIAVQYFLAELPFFINTPKILNVTSSTFIYKDMPKFLKYIYNKNLLVSSRQRFLKVNVQCH